MTDKTQNRDMLCIKNRKRANVIFTYHGMTAEQAAEVAAWKEESSEREVVVASTDWFARVYFSGKAEPVPRAPPAFLDDEGMSLLVCVPDLGNEDTRRRVMYHLEVRLSLGATADISATGQLSSTSHWRTLSFSRMDTRSSRSLSRSTNTSVGAMSTGCFRRSLRRSGGGARRPAWHPRPRR